jgi:hypothetical protein
LFPLKTDGANRPIRPVRRFQESICYGVTDPGVVEDPELVPELPGVELLLELEPVLEDPGVVP